MDEEDRKKMVIFIDGKITKEPVDAKHLTICSNVCLF